jgi:hypothetical protein
MKQSHSGGDLSRQEGNPANHAEGFGELLENAHGNEAQVERIQEPEAMQHHLEEAYVQMVLAVAYSAIIGARPYKTPKTPAEAESELNRCAGTQFDPRVVEAFMQIEIFDPHTGGWKNQATATRGRAQAVALPA